MSHKKLSKYSGYLFTLSSIIGLLKHLSQSGFKIIANIAALCVNMLAHIVWLLALEKLPEQRSQDSRQSGFIGFKAQSRTTAILGFTGSLCFLLSMVLPVLMYVGLWCTALSSVLWLSSEYHRFYYPPQGEENYCSSKQHTYLKYVAFMTLASVSTASLVTLPLVLPAMTALLLAASTVFSFLLSMNALQYWLAQFDFTPENRSSIAEPLIPECSRALSHPGFALSSPRPKTYPRCSTHALFQPTARSGILQCRQADTLQNEIRNVGIK
ncbi:MAG: hypothetical protein JJT82_08245 [Legionellaceae bacterium]|nr:hypothetical protein [Legionellaceae bacterium]